MLLNNSGKMCCLGFLAIKEGLAKEDIENILNPSGISKSIIKRTKYLRQLVVKSNLKHRPTDLCYALMSANDNPGFLPVAGHSELDGLSKEAALKVLFKKIDVAVKFIP